MVETSNTASLRTVVPTELEILPSSRLVLAPAFRARVEQYRQQHHEQADQARIVPLSPEAFMGPINLVTDGAGLSDLVALARQRPLTCVGIDFENRYSCPGVWIRRYLGDDLYWHDPGSCVPLLLSVVLVEMEGGSRMRLYRFVIDCRKFEDLEPLADLFRLPVPFAGHYVTAELICLWRLGLPIPDRVWDTWVAEKAMLLGLFHCRYRTEHPMDDAEETEAKEDAAAEAELKCNLPATCERRGVPYAFAAEKARLQKSFLDHPDSSPFTTEQIEYNAADAEASARLYFAQTQAATAQGCLQHLIEVEMPWTVTNARLHWDGVRTDPQQCQSLLAACVRHIERVGTELREAGLENVNSHPQLIAFFHGAGLLDIFAVRGGYSFADDRLEAAEARHPVVGKIRQLRKARRLLSDKALTGELVGADGRLHPDHRQLGAESGRNAMRWPNIGGIGRALRPVVVPDEGYGIGEVDLSQIEVGIAAAVYNDPDLIRMFNGKDVYICMAKDYFAAALPPGAGSLSDQAFKSQYGVMRDRMKVFTLATIYNITAHGLALRLNISPEQAAEEQKRFLDMFPSLARALREASAYGVIRGYAYVCSGLRRWRARPGYPTAWETNWMRNTPVQGSAGVVFKVAGNRLFRRYQHYKAKLILPMHDAFVFEAPLQHLKIIAAITTEVLKSSVQEYFPCLDPQVAVNIDYPGCWNKDGKHDSLIRWIEGAG